MSPQERIYKHKDLIELALEHGYIPHASQANFGEVKAALQEIDGISRDGSCHGCISEVIRCANVHLKAYEDTFPKPQVHEPVKHTFPKHERKKRK